MESKQLQQVKVITDVVCDVCNQSTKLEFAILSAHWGYGSTHDGERYESQLSHTSDIKKRAKRYFCLIKILILQA